MKKISIILTFLFAAFISFAQFPNTQILSPSNAKTLTKGLGGLGSDSGFIFLKNFTDTASANVGFLKNISGIAIRVNDTIYVRSSCVCQWLKIGYSKEITTLYPIRTTSTGDTIYLAQDFINSIGGGDTRLISTGGIVLLDTIVGVNADIIWQRNGVLDTQTTASAFPIPRAAEGYKRTDIIVITAADTLARRQGVADSVIAVAPDLVAGDILVAYVNVAVDSTITANQPSILQRNAVVYVNPTNGAITTDSTQFSWNNAATDLQIGTTKPIGTSSSISLNSNRFILQGNFNGGIINVGSGLGVGQPYDVSKSIRFMNRGNLYAQMGSSSQTNHWTKIYGKLAVSTVDSVTSPYNVAVWVNDTLRKAAYPTTYTFGNGITAYGNQIKWADTITTTSVFATPTNTIEFKTKGFSGDSAGLKIGPFNQSYLYALNSGISNGISVGGGGITIDGNNSIASNADVFYLKDKITAALPKYKQQAAVLTDAQILIYDTTDYKIKRFTGTLPSGSTPTLQQVLDNNHDLVNGINLQGTGSGSGNSGADINSFGGSALENNIGNDVNAFGNSSGRNNNGNDVNAMGRGSANGNDGFNVNAFGYEAGQSNVYGNVNLFGRGASATDSNQTSLAGSTYQARIDYNRLSANQKYDLPDSSGTIALLSNITSTDSTIFYTVYRSDTSRANIYTSLANKVQTGSDGSLKSLTITGTNGAGHIHLRHQASLPAATANSSVIYANSDGDFAWKNDGNYHTTLATNLNTANRVYTFQNKSYTVADSADVVAKQDTGLSWNKSGNNNINAGNFLGSTNNSSLRFRTNNTERLIIDTLGGMQMKSLANNATLTNAFQLANTNNRSYFNISASTSLASLTLKANNDAVLDSMVINDSGLIQPRSNATLWLKGNTTSGVNVVANRAAGAGSGSIFSANVGTSAPIFNMVSTSGLGQMTINGETPAASAALDITSTTRGLLIPRMITAQRDAITSPAAGLQVYNTSTNALEYWNGSVWVSGLTNGTQTIAGAKTFSNGITLGANMSAAGWNISSVGQLGIVTGSPIINQSGATLSQILFNSGGGLTLSNNLASAVTPLIISVINASSTANITEFSSSLSSTALTIGRSGLIGMWGTNTAAGTTGAQTINKPSGVVNFAAGATTLVVTNSLATTSSIINVTVYGADLTAISARVTRAGGSFTITLNAAATAETAVSFTLQNIN